MDADNMMRFPPHYYEGQMPSPRLSDHAIRGDEDQPKKWHFNMKWYYQIKGTHVHVRVFMNGANCGELCFRKEEFDDLLNKLAPVQFINETK